jgi:hypothetical protein
MTSQFNIRPWNDMAKPETLARKLPSADIAVRTAVLAVKAHQPEWSLKLEPADSGRSPSNMDPGPSGFDWT